MIHVLTIADKLQVGRTHSGRLGTPLGESKEGPSLHMGPKFSVSEGQNPLGAKFNGCQGLPSSKCGKLHKENWQEVPVHRVSPNYHERIQIFHCHIQMLQFKSRFIWCWKIYNFLHCDSFNVNVPIYYVWLKFKIWHRKPGFFCVWCVWAGKCAQDIETKKTVQTVFLG